MSSVLIRQAVERGGSKTFQDQQIDTDEISIGASADNTLMLQGASVEQRHAVFRISDDAVQVRSGGKHKLTVDSSEVSQADVDLGIEIKIGPHTVSVIRPPQGFSLALLVEVSDAPDGDLEENYRTSLLQTGLSKRWASWTLAAVTLIVTLLIPLASTYLWAPESGEPPAPVLSDIVWTTGDLHAAHQTHTQDNCAVCHETLFTPVQDSACESCHERTLDHATPELMLAGDMTDYRCAQCHGEHNEPSSWLIAGAVERCGSCHEFDSLGEGHPDFTGYPSADTASVLFDHVTHQGTHYTETNHDFICDECHQRDRSGQFQLTTDFESMCINCHGDGQSDVPSKIFHHGDQIVTGKHITFFSMPRLDLRSIPEEQIGIWPADSRKASRTGLGRLDVTHITQLLLSADPEVAPALDRLLGARVKLSKLRRATPEQMEDVVSIVWGIKRLLVELAANPQKTIESRLRRVHPVDSPVTGIEVIALSGEIRAEFVRETVNLWFPETGVAGLREELAARGDAVAEDDEGDEYRTIPGEEWVQTGTWDEDKFSIRYQVSGHADDMMRSWLETLSPLSLRVEGGPENHHAEVFEVLAEVEKGPGKATGPGRCGKCHFVEPGAELLWSRTIDHYGELEHTRFDHTAHVNASGVLECANCHTQGEAGGLLARLTSEEESQSGTGLSSFEPVSRESCSGCHNPAGSASDGCLTCHNYHVTEPHSGILALESAR